MANQAAIFIDGGYLVKVLGHEFSAPRIDFQKLAIKMAGDDELFRALLLQLPPLSRQQSVGRGIQAVCKGSRIRGRTRPPPSF